LRKYEPGDEVRLDIEPPEVTNEMSITMDKEECVSPENHQEEGKPQPDNGDKETLSAQDNGEYQTRSGRVSLNWPDSTTLSWT